MLLDDIAGIFELIDFLINWRFWLCFIGAIAISFFIHEHVGIPALSWVLSAPVLVVGSVSGWVWNKSSG